MKLKRVVRYLLGMPRLVYLYDLQDPFKHIDLFTDTDIAGCQTTRRSTSGGVAMVGTHCVRHFSTTQSTISLSSGEAELHGISKGMHHAMGLRSMYKDLGLPLRLRINYFQLVTSSRREVQARVCRGDIFTYGFLSFNISEAMSEFINLCFIGQQTSKTCVSIV